jgi:hypothetical protein
LFHLPESLRIRDPGGGLFDRPSAFPHGATYEYSPGRARGNHRFGACCRTARRRHCGARPDAGRDRGRQRQLPHDGQRRRLPLDHLQARVRRPRRQREGPLRAVLRSSPCRPTAPSPPATPARPSPRATRIRWARSIATRCAAAAAWRTSAATSPSTAHGRAKGSSRSASGVSWYTPADAEHRGQAPLFHAAGSLPIRDVCTAKWGIDDRPWRWSWPRLAP